MGSRVFSNGKELDEIIKTIINYARLPFAADTIPGAVLEATLARVRDGQRCRTYKFVDVIKPDIGVGWQVKSTKAGTPVTWKRAKLPNSREMIAASEGSPKAIQALGDAILEFCNHAIKLSMREYDLQEIGYARLIVHKNLNATYFERVLVTAKQPILFSPKDFEWRWSVQKKTVKKEQLSALHGIHKPSGKKWFAWHGRGENQLHFSGERNWWPEKERNCRQFTLPDERHKIDPETFDKLLLSLNRVEKQ